MGTQYLVPTVKFCEAISGVSAVLLGWRLPRQSRRSRLRRRSEVSGHFTAPCTDRGHGVFSRTRGLSF